jgi:hypothetical protein
MKAAVLTDQQHTSARTAGCSAGDEKQGSLSIHAVPVTGNLRPAVFTSHTTTHTGRENEKLYSTCAVAAAVHVRCEKESVLSLSSRKGHAVAACQELPAAYAVRAAHTPPRPTHSQADPQRQACTAVNTHYLTTHEEEFDQQKCQPSATPEKLEKTASLQHCPSRTQPCLNAHAHVAARALPEGLIQQMPHNMPQVASEKSISTAVHVTGQGPAACEADLSYMSAHLSPKQQQQLHTHTHNTRN